MISGDFWIWAGAWLLTDHQSTKLLWNNSASISKLLIYPVENYYNRETSVSGSKPRPLIPSVLGHP